MPEFDREKFFETGDNFAVFGESGIYRIKWFQVEGVKLAATNCEKLKEEDTIIVEGAVPTFLVLWVGEWMEWSNIIRYEQVHEPPFTLTEVRLVASQLSNHSSWEEAQYGLSPKVVGAMMYWLLSKVSMLLMIDTDEQKA